MLKSYSAAFGHFVNQLHLPRRKTQRENFLRLGAAFLQRRSLPVRRLARTLAGPTPQAKTTDNLPCPAGPESGIGRRDEQRILLRP